MTSQPIIYAFTAVPGFIAVICNLIGPNWYFFQYLGFVVHAQGWNEEDITARIAAAWKKWKELSGVLCNRSMPIAVKGKVYRTMVRPVLIYGSETWTLKRREEERLERTKMRMLRWILGLTLRDEKRNDDICRILGVVCITDKVREARLTWLGHVQRREEQDCVRRILAADVCGQRSKGRQRKRWIDVVSTKWRTCGSTWWTWRMKPIE